MHTSKKSHPLVPVFGLRCFHVECSGFEGQIQLSRWPRKSKKGEITVEAIKTIIINRLVLWLCLLSIIS